MRVDAVLPAAGRIAGDFASEAGAEVKALIRLAGRTLLESTLAALRATARVDRIVVVGPQEIAPPARAAGADEALPEAGDTGSANMLRGLDWLQEQADGENSVLVVTTDLPFLTPEALDAFLDACPATVGFCVPVVTRDEFEARFPGHAIRYVKMRDGQWMTGCVFLVRPRAVSESRATIEGVFLRRKSPIAMARLLGPAFIFRLLARRLTIRDIEDRCYHLLGHRGAAIRACPPELVFDIDRPLDYRYARDHLGR